MQNCRFALACLENQGAPECWDEGAGKFSSRAVCEPLETTLFISAHGSYCDKLPVLNGVACFRAWWTRAVGISTPTPNAISVANATGREAFVAGRLALVTFNLSNSGYRLSKSKINYAVERLTCMCDTQISPWSCLCESLFPSDVWWTVILSSWFQKLSETCGCIVFHGT
jgi:hypothetical protein